MATRRSFLIQLGLLAAGAGAIWYARDHIVFPAPGVRFAEGKDDSGWLPFASRRQPLVTVKATVNGREVDALVDSGAQFSVIDRAFAQTFGPEATYPLPVMAYGVGGQPQMGRGITLDVSLGGLALDRLKAAVLDLGPLSGGAGVSVPLIIGQDVLSAVIADIDFPARRVRFVSRERHVLPAGAVAAPVRKDGKALMAQVTVEGRPLEVVVDTGASAALSLTTETAQAMGLLDGRPARSAQSLVLGGVMWGRNVEAREVGFAGQTVKEAEVHIFPSQPLPGFPKGLLGQGVLRGFRVILDHGEGRMHLVTGYVPITLGD